MLRALFAAHSAGVHLELHLLHTVLVRAPFTAHSAGEYLEFCLRHTVLVYASDMLGQNLGEWTGVAASFQRLFCFCF